MAAVRTGTLVVKDKRLPAAARRLVAENRLRRLDFRGGAAGFYGDLEKTTAYLKWKADCGTLIGTLNYVAEEIERERLYLLYRRLFPGEWRRSTASFRKKGEHEFHTEREFEFIKLISERYFPLESWLDWTDYQFDHIPVEPVNLDLCCGEFEWQEFRPCLQFGVAAFLYRGGGLYDTDWHEILANFKLEIEDLPPISHENPPFNKLERQRDDPRVRRFLHLIEFIHHDSGNPFIDTTCCSPIDLFEWTRENLEYLKTEYGKVKDYFESMDTLDRDIERAPLETFTELISLWNDGELPGKKRKKEAAGNGAKSGQSQDAGLLINLLADMPGDLASLNL